jgi:glycosyltransferase involved in cell wall biosynthesis
MASKLWQIRQGAHVAGNNITVLTPTQVPDPASSIARKINKFTVCRAIRKVLNQLPDYPVQIWSFAPDVGDLIGCFNEEAVLYYCVDAFAEFPGYNRPLIEKREQELIDRSDVVVATSPPLYETKRQQHANVHFIQHGVNHRHFARALQQDLPIPVELAALPQPIYGFVGMVGEWMDRELIAGLARRRPDASIVMIGPRDIPLGPCAGLKNIHWLGERSYYDLPHYLRAFDVGLIPFRKIPVTINANPIKLYEYLAAGLPVVSTSLPAVRQIPGSVWLADDAESLADCCAKAGAVNEPETRHRRSKMMWPESWSQRVEQLSELVSRTLPEESSDTAHKRSRPRKELVPQTA